MVFWQTVRMIVIMSCESCSCEYQLSWRCCSRSSSALLFVQFGSVHKLIICIDYWIQKCLLLVHKVRHGNVFIFIVSVSESHCVWPVPQILTLCLYLQTQDIKHLTLFHLRRDPLAVQSSVGGGAIARRNFSRTSSIPWTNPLWRIRRMSRPSPCQGH